MPKSLRRPLAASLLALLALAAPGAVARADGDAPPADEGVRTVIKYASCAGGLAFAPNVGTAFAAFMACAKMLMDEISTYTAP